MELVPHVLGPRHKVPVVAAHGPDLPVAEHGLGAEGLGGPEGLGDLLLEAGYPGRVDGHLGEMRDVAEPV